MREGRLVAVRRGDSAPGSPSITVNLPSEHLNTEPHRLLQGLSCPLAPIGLSGPTECKKAPGNGVECTLKSSNTDITVVSCVPRPTLPNIEHPWGGGFVYPRSAGRFCGAGVQSGACPGGRLLELQSTGFPGSPACGSHQWSLFEGGVRGVSSGGRESEEQQSGDRGAPRGCPWPLPVPDLARVR